MLFTPWRDEVIGLLTDCGTHKERYNQLKVVIDVQKAIYEKISSEIDKAVEDAKKDAVLQQGNEIIAPSTEHAQQEDQSLPTTDSQLYASFNPGNAEHHRIYDISEDLSIHPDTDTEEQLVRNRPNDEDYRSLVATLNKDEKEFFYHVLHWVKTKEEPLYCFLSGGAGVGKTWVIKAIYQAFVKYFNSQPSQNPDYITVLKVAHTGKAAFIIRGNTAHSALMLQPNTHNSTITSSKLNTARCFLGKLKVLIVDEISLFGTQLF